MAHIYKRGKTWTVRFSKRQKIFNPETNEYESVLKQKSKGGFRTKAEAQKYGIEMESASISGVDVTEDLLFKDYFTQWFDTVKSVGKKRSSIRSYKFQKNLILSKLGNLKLKDIDTLQYQAFINDIAKSHSLRYVKSVHGMVNSFINFAINDGKLNRNFARNAKIYGNEQLGLKTDYLNNTEMKMLIDICLKDIKKEPLDVRPYAIILGLNTGMRIGEVSAITWNDLDYENGIISVNKTWYSTGKITTAPKTKSSIRDIPVNKDLLHLLDPLKELDNDHQFIFFNKTSSMPYRDRVYTVYLRNALSRLGIKKENIRFHSLRHSHVAYLISQGVDIYAISHRLGHANLSITLNTYAYLVDETKEKQDKIILDKLNGLMHK